MHKILALSTITGFLFLLTSITSIAFEDKKIDAKNNIVYEIKSILDDYVLSYCSTYDSFTINRLYSQKKILNNLEKNNKLNNKLIVSIKNKPINIHIKSSIFEDDLKINKSRTLLVRAFLVKLGISHNRIKIETNE